MVDRTWEDAIHFRPEDFNEFWSERLQEKRDILIILGLGWDPRMTVILKVIKSFGGRGIRHIHSVQYKPHALYRSPFQKYIEKNTIELNQLAQDWAQLEDINIITRDEENSYVGDEEVSEKYTRFDLSAYTDILVDISALPKSLYFTLLFILVTKSLERPSINVHLTACQDVELDNEIIESADENRYLKGFKGGVTRFGHQDSLKIWTPLLGSNYSVSLRELYSYIGPKDVYPILPFPSHNPRHDDDLLMEYRNIFVNVWDDFNPTNIMYAVEDDPLDVYRSLVELYQRQRNVLEPLGNVQMIVSSLSSKLSSIGAFMAAFEQKMAVAHSIGRHSSLAINESYWDEEHFRSFKQNLHSIWLTGEPYG